MFQVSPATTSAFEFTEMIWQYRPAILIQGADKIVCYWIKPEVYRVENDALERAITDLDPLMNGAESLFLLGYELRVSPGVVE